MSLSKLSTSFLRLNRVQRLHAQIFNHHAARYLMTSTAFSLRFRDGPFDSPKKPRGKNIYYGYSKEENRYNNSTTHKVYVTWMISFLIFTFVGARPLIQYLGWDIDSREIGEKDDTEEPSSSSEAVVGKHKKKRMTFKEKRIKEYENRIRMYSTPDKIFRYFATLKVRKHEANSPDHNEIYMTPEDFVRSLMPGILQPPDLGLDKFKRFDPETDSLSEAGDSSIQIRKDSIFYRLEKHGLISFSDYIFLLTLLSTPPRQFELAFKMFDHNGDGDLDMDEYGRVQAIIRARTKLGQRHRDHANTGNVIKTDVTGALTKYFFGEHCKQKLSYLKFLEFHREIHDEVLWIEFHEFCDESGIMTERDFAFQILQYAGFSDQKTKHICKRVRRKFKPGEDEQLKGIHFQEYYGFAQVLKSISEIDTALTFYHVAGASIDKQTFKHVSKTVAGVELTDHLVDVVFAIFDENDDERLSNKEFVAVMKRRLMRGLEKPRETGFSKLFGAISKCSKSTFYAWLHKADRSYNPYKA